MNIKIWKFNKIKVLNEDERDYWICTIIKKINKYKELGIMPDIK